MDDKETQILESLGAGSGDEASAALGRLLGVTQAGIERRAQLEQALKSRVAIEQAKGVLAERYTLALDEAFEVIRSASRSHRIKLHDLVATIKPGVETPPELQRALAERGHV